MNRQFGIALAMVAIAWTASANAQSDLIDATDPGGMRDIIRQLGYRALLETDEYGDPRIATSVGGTTVYIYFYDCTDNADCRTIMYAGRYDPADNLTAEAMNDWNRDELFGRAYIDEDGYAWIELPVNTDGGISRANFESTFARWENIVAQFESEMGL